MAREEFTVRITKKGEIIIEAEGLPARRVKDLIKHFEETLGPARLLEQDDDGAAGDVEIDDALGREFEEEQEKQREGDWLRLKEP